MHKKKRLSKKIQKIFRKKDDSSLFASKSNGESQPTRKLEMFKMLRSAVCKKTLHHPLNADVEQARDDESVKADVFLEPPKQDDDELSLIPQQDEKTSDDEFSLMSPPTPVSAIFEMPSTDARSWRSKGRSLSASSTIQSYRSHQYYDYKYEDDEYSIGDYSLLEADELDKPMALVKSILCYPVQTCGCGRSKTLRV